METGNDDPDDWQSPGSYGRPGEISPYNPEAVRGPNGIWNEETLPVMEREAAEHRVVVPLRLQSALELETAVLRWSREKRALVQNVHPQLVEQRQLSNLTYYLDKWQFAGPSETDPTTFRVFSQEHQRWTLAVMVINKNSSTNFVTLFSPSRLTRLPNMIRKENYSKRKRSLVRTSKPDIS